MPKAVALLVAAGSGEPHGANPPQAVVVFGGRPLVELELLMSQPTDSRDEFSDVFDFDQAFERDYPWCAQLV